MLAHILPACGTLIHLNVSNWGIGAMIAASATHLKYVEPPVFCNWQNEFYTRQCGFDTNCFLWIFKQTEIYSTFKRTVIDWDPSTYGINEHRTVLQIESLRQKIHEYWEIQPCLLSQASNKLDGKSSILGIHYRGTDKYTEVKLQKVDVIVEHARRVCYDRQLSHILLCTDDQNVMDSMVRQFPNLIRFDNHLRTRGQIGVHELLGSKRQCCEAMCEILALGMCDHLLLGRSCVGDAALLMAQNPKITWEYY